MKAASKALAPGGHDESCPYSMLTCFLIPSQHIPSKCICYVCICIFACVCACFSVQALKIHVFRPFHYLHEGRRHSRKHWIVDIDTLNIDKYVFIYIYICSRLYMVFYIYIYTLHNIYCLCTHLYLSSMCVFLLQLYVCTLQYICRCKCMKMN